MPSPSQCLLPPSPSYPLLPSLSPSQQIAYLSNLPHLIEAGKYSQCYRHLTDFNFITTKVHHPDFGIYSLLKDYQLLPLEAFNSEESQTLEIIGQTLHLAAHILKDEPEQLGTQLWGRMQNFELSGVQMLLRQAVTIQSKPWLRPLTTSLIPPGGNLLWNISGHSSSVTAVAVTPNGQKIISGSSDKTVKVWDATTGENLLTFNGHSNSVGSAAALATQVAVSPDGRKVISSSHDKIVKMWDITTGEQLITFDCHSSSVGSIAVTPDGEKVISGSYDKTVKVWDITAGEQLITFTGHSSPIGAVAVTPDGKKVISTSYSVKVWDITTGEQIITFNTGSSTVAAVAITPDGEKVISGSYDKTVKVWDMNTGENIRRCWMEV